MANSNGWGDGAANNAIGWGQGANNAIGWGDIHAKSYAGATDISGLPTTDPDAQAFITAAAITDPTQQSAINQLVVDLKGYSIWTKFDALYPMVGGTASSHKFNLKNPLDTDAAFRLFFGGGWTHSSTGATPGVNGYADSFCKTVTNININSHSFGIYSRTNDTTGTQAYGVFSGAGFSTFILHTISSGNFYSGLNTNTIAYTANPSTSLLMLTRRSSSDWQAYRAGVSLGTQTTAGGIESGKNFYFGARNQGDGAAAFYCKQQLAFAFIGDGLTNTESLNFYTAIQAFQTTLGRSIGTQTVSDADAQAFVTAANIQDQVEADAINNLVIGMKADGLWTKMKAVYPFVGGTSTSTSYNLKNTAQYQISWNGGVTHASTGVTFNGSNGYGNTNFAPNSVLTANSNHVALYSRTAAARTNGLAIDFGQGADVNIQSGIFGCSRRSSNVAYYGATNATTNGSFTAANTNGSGFFTNSITAATSRKIYRNGSVLGSLTTNISQTLSAAKMYIAAFNNNDAGVLLYSNYEASFFSIGDGLDDTEATNLNTRVTTFQTALNRNI